VPLNKGMPFTPGNVALFLRTLHTVRYLKPVQVFGRIWFRLHSPSIRLSPALPVRKRTVSWVQPPSKHPSLLSPSCFRLLNEEHDVLCPADWNRPDWEKLWLYHLHYFDDLNAEDAGKRRDWHKALIERWTAENPPGKGNGWEPYPLSRRIVNWVQWIWRGNGTPPGTAESLAVQARYLRKRLEWHILGNHLLANSKALIFAGLFFEGAEADGWLAKGTEILSRQLKEQVLTDGGHFERSPMYHAQVLEDILDTVNATRTFPDVRFAGREKLLEECSESATRMLAWLNVMTHPDGQIALLNDAAFGMAAEPAALAAYAERMGISQAEACSGESGNSQFGTPALVPRRALDPRVRGGDRHSCHSRESGNPGSLPPQALSPVRFTCLADSGYVRVECNDAVAFLDVAPVGPDYLPGHAHGDTLSFELSLGTQRVIVDSGVSRYGEGPERLRQRGTAAHNTVTINGQDSSEVWGGFRVARRAYPRNLEIRETEGLVSCAHDGYRRLPGRPVHRREWRFLAGGVKIRDVIEGEFREATGQLHFHPEVKSFPSSETCAAGKLVLPDGREMRWQIVKGQGRLLDTTWHPEFGLSIPNLCLEIGFTDRQTEVELSW